MWLYDHVYNNYIGNKIAMKKSLKAEDIDCLRNYPRLPENLGDDDLEYQ